MRGRVQRWLDQRRKGLARRRALWTLLWRAARWQAVVVGGLAVLQGLAPTGAILATGVLVGAVPDAVRDGAGSPAAGQAMLGLGLFGAVLIAGGVLAALVNYLVQDLNGRYGREVHRTVAQATLGTRGVAVLEDPTVAGELAALDEFERADGLVSTVSDLRTIVQERATGVGAFVVLFGFAWWAPLVMLAGWRGLVLGIRRWVEHGFEIGAKLGADEMRRSRYLRSLAVESAAAKEVRIFGLADWLVRGYAETYWAALSTLWANRKLGVSATAWSTLGVIVAHLVVLGVLGQQAVAGALSVAQLVVFVSATMATNALGWIGDPETGIARARQVAGQVVDLQRRLASETDVAPGAVSEEPQPDRRRSGERDERPADVRVSDVRFTYRGRSEPTLDGFDLTVAPGTSLAIVGENGVGKSTLIKLLCGMYEPDDGRITVDGVIPTNARSRIAVIFQDFVRYELSLRANVSFGALDLAADPEGLAEALADAGGGDLPDRLVRGWDTVLSAGYPDGQDLSGGQWQKVALARAMAAVRSGAGLLILDEPTAALDVRSETELFDRFLEFTKGVTTILVSHRLASVRHADRIVVIAGGRIVEDGTHTDLLDAGGRYATMFRLQAERFAGEATDESNGDPNDEEGVDA